MLVELNDVLNNAYEGGMWGTPTLLRYLSEGQDKFCEETGYWRDVDNFTLTLKTGVVRYAVPDRVIEVMEIWNGTNKLGKYSHDDIKTTGFEFDPFSIIAQTGMPTEWKIDEGTGLITFDKTPTATENRTSLQLRVWRYSLCDLADDNAEPELPARLQRACVEWAAYKAFNHHDMEAQDPVKGKEHYANFMAYVTDGKKALRRLHGIDVEIASNPLYRA